MNTKFIDLEVSKKVYTNVVLEVPEFWTEEEVLTGYRNQEVSRVIKKKKIRWETANQDDLSIESLNECAEHQKKTSTKV